MTVKPARQTKKIATVKTVRATKPTVKKPFSKIKKATAKIAKNPIVKKPATKKTVSKTVKSKATTAKKLTEKRTSAKPQTIKKPTGKVKKTKPQTKKVLFKDLLENAVRKVAPKISKKRVSKTRTAKKVAAVEPTTEIKPRKKPIRAISSAVFRGVQSQYDFKVYAINEIPKQEQAIYIISRRVTDRHKRGHHKLVCIGQTDSIRESIRKNKKGKCIKENAANVICILAEADEQKRQKIEADLKAAHSIVCNQQ
ncbi:MAG: hypothetical protein ACR2F2_10370 [Pyrinomonadaceae bacterium]